MAKSSGINISSITYPDSDRRPMADNTLQFSWIVVIKENLELQFAEAEDVFIAGDQALEALLKEKGIDYDDLIE